MLQSRLTVAGDTLSTSAVSSTLSPPKKRISMICTLRGSRRAECIHRVIERHQIAGSIGTHDGDIVEGDVLHTRPALYVMAAGMIDQYAPHHLRRNREEMRPILPFHALVVHQTHIGFIHQGSRLERVAGALALPCSDGPGGEARHTPWASARRARSASPSLQARRSLLISFLSSSLAIPRPIRTADYIVRLPGNFRRYPLATSAGLCAYLDNGSLIN